MRLYGDNVEQNATLLLPSTVFLNPISRVIYAHYWMKGEDFLLLVFLFNLR